LKNWSGDKKYCAVKDGTKFLLRISPRKKYKNRKKIHKIMQKLASKDIPMCKPLKIGLCKEGVYVLQSWVDGVDAEENIHNYSKAQQYDFGFQADKQHGDYHIGNMIIANDKIVIIDFDRYDFGDPWEEFNRIVWAAQTSPEFACGMVDGYFDNNVPELFWKLLKLYIGSNTMSSVPWAVDYSPKQTEVMLNQAKDVLAWYDNYTLTVPKWYKS